MARRNIGYIVVAILLICSIAYPQEIITGFNKEDLAVLNEELRRLRNKSSSSSSSNNYATSSDVIPSGGIIMWSGAIADIPAGWYLCDGSNGTPDLTDRFVIHADADSGGTNNVGDTGGANSFTLTVSQLPPHTHTINHTHTGDNIISGSDWQMTSDEFSNNKSTTSDTYSGNSGSTGSGSAIDNRPKYYALAFIMKG